MLITENVPFLKTISRPLLFALSRQRPSVLLAAAATSFMSSSPSSPPSAIWPSSGKTIIDGPPCASVMRYHHVGVAASDISTSLSFYEKLGFLPTTNTAEAAGEGRILQHSSSGMSIHLVPATEKWKDGQNGLMDYPKDKYPGHTHMALYVPSVPAARTYLEEQLKIPISGERNMGGALRAVFVRDPDRTTLEFERNVGPMADMSSFGPEHIGDGRPIDHVGTRVTNPEDRWVWYAEKLGFVNEVMKYEANKEDPLKNEPPFIGRSDANIDINLIVNANREGNPLLDKEKGAVYPGILYAAYVVGNLDAAITALKAAGCTVASEEEAPAVFGLPSQCILPVSDKSGKAVGTCFLSDPDGTLFRLVPDTVQ